MSSRSSQPKKTIVTEEGELRDVPDNSAASRLASVYCTQCGTPNRQDSHYCRNCGTPLDDNAPARAAYMPDDYLPTEKPKRTIREERSQAPVWANLVTEVFTLGAVFLMSVAAIVNGAPALVVAILIAWFMVVAARNGVLN
jgi:hypothetical protein